MRKDDTHYCIECGVTLPWRYKGRQRIYCSQTCRKAFTEKKKNNSIWIGVLIAFVIALGAYLRSIGFFPN
mgnify:CR=1 FL=1